MPPANLQLSYRSNFVGNLDFDSARADNIASSKPALVVALQIHELSPSLQKLKPFAQ